MEFQFQNYFLSLAFCIRIFGLLCTKNHTFRAFLCWYHVVHCSSGKLILSALSLASIIFDPTCGLKLTISISGLTDNTYLMSKSEISIFFQGFFFHFWHYDHFVGNILLAQKKQNIQLFTGLSLIIKVLISYLIFNFCKCCSKCTATYLEVCLL